MITWGSTTGFRRSHNSAGGRQRVGSIGIETMGGETIDSLVESGSGSYLGQIPPDLESSYLTLSGYRSKPVVDVVVASLAALAFAPVFVAAAIAVRVTSRGPVFTFDEHIGKRGRRFKQAGFRIVSNNKARRLTLVGRALDHTGLYKLPQLYNVLRGEMSMVGPKALYPAETHYYGSALPIILSINPGILQPRPIPKDGRSYEDGSLVQSELDFDYVADRSAALDIKICIDALSQKTLGQS